MKKIIYLIQICILSMLNLSESNAQGLSLSFNLTENDTLANMIADSKKYEISSLTLSGVINDCNTLYIQDLNINGKLLNLDLTNVNSISPGKQIREKNIYGYTKYQVSTISKILQQYGCPKKSADSLANEFPGHSTYNLVQISIKDQIFKDQTIRSYDLVYEPAAYFWGTKRNSKTCEFSTSVSYPLRIFDINNFKKFILPNNLLTIGGSDCTYRVKSCENYILGKKVKTIGENAFKNSNIETLTHFVPIDSIKAFAFENAKGKILTDQQLLEQAMYIGEGALKNSDLLDNTDICFTLQAKRIGKQAFLNAMISNTISLPNIEEMGDSVFMNTNINNIEIGDNLKTISTCSFAHCTKLQTFEGGTNISNIGKGAFRECNKLLYFTPANVLTTIGQEAFFRDSSLTQFTIPYGTTKIGHGAFSGSGIKTLQLGNYGDFRRDIIAGCNSLETISVSNDNESLSSNNGVLFSKDGKRIIAYPFAKKDTIYEIDNGVIEVQDSAFFDVKFLISLSIPESLETIGKNAFANSGIYNVKLLPSIPPKVTNNQSGLNQSNVNLYVHEKDYSTYYIANYWGDFKNIFILEKDLTPWTNGIQTISDTDNTEIVRRYDLNGRLVTSSYHGVSILKMSDGTTKKVFVK